MRVYFSLTVICTLFIISGCNSYTGEASPQQKEASLAKLDITHISGEPIDTFIDRRVAQLFDNVEKATLKRIAGDKYTVSIKGSSGSAIAVSEHGYYLTAAHCLDDINGIFLREGSNIPKKARVVWKSDDIDFGVIKVDSEVKHYFSIANTLPDVKTSVILGSSKAGHGGNSAGTVLGIDKTLDGYSSHAVIFHSCPISSGDSGGPLITLDGKLLAVNHSSLVKERGLFHKSTYSMATAVNQEWLNQLIQEDITSESIGRPEGRP